MNKKETDCIGFTGHTLLSQNPQVLQMQAEVALTRRRCKPEPFEVYRI